MESLAQRLLLSCSSWPPYTPPLPDDKQSKNPQACSSSFSPPSLFIPSSFLPGSLLLSSFFVLAWLSLSRFVSVAPTGKNNPNKNEFVCHFVGIVFPTALRKGVQQCCIQSLDFGSSLTSEAFLFTAKMALCVDYVYTATCKANKGFQGPFQVEECFWFTLALKRKANCLAWHFLLIAMATTDTFAHEFVALEVEFHSTLAPALQHTCITLNTSWRTFFQCEVALTSATGN